MLVPRVTASAPASETESFFKNMEGIIVDVV
jgi:hypothetical protein